MWKKKNMFCSCLSTLSPAGAVQLQRATEAAKMLVYGYVGTQCHARRCGMKCLTLAPRFHHL